MSLLLFELILEFTVKRARLVALRRESFIARNWEKILIGAISVVVGMIINRFGAQFLK
jgi:hypothetical protein